MKIDLLYYVLFVQKKKLEVPVVRAFLVVLELVVIVELLVLFPIYIVQKTADLIKQLHIII